MSREDLSRRDFLSAGVGALALWLGLVEGGPAAEAEADLKAKEELQKLREKFPGLNFDERVAPKPGQPVILLVEPGVDIIDLAKHLATNLSSPSLLVEKKLRFMEQPGVIERLKPQPKEKRVLVTELSFLQLAAELKLELERKRKLEKELGEAQPGTLSSFDKEIQKLQEDLGQHEANLPTLITNYLRKSTEFKQDQFKKRYYYLLRDGRSPEKLTDDEKKSLLKYMPPLFVMIVARVDKTYLERAVNETGTGVVVVSKK